MEKDGLYKQDGFTLIELVVVIVLLGILAAFAIPRFFEMDVFRVRATYDEVAGAVRYAQKLAVASGCDVRVVTSSSNNRYALQQRTGAIAFGSACPTGGFADILNHPVESPTTVAVPISDADFSFDAMGRCSSGAAITVGTSPDDKTITIVAETGYVDAP